MLCGLAQLWEFVCKLSVLMRVASWAAHAGQHMQGIMLSA
jgi:hypothetical protein